MQEDILTAICDRPDTWTRLLVNMEVLTIQVGVRKTKTWKTMTEDLKNEDSGKRRPGSTFIDITKLLKTRTYRWQFVVLQLTDRIVIY